MINKKFELYKLRRELKRDGTQFTFMRNSLNEFNEPGGDPIEVVTVVGLYHETNSYVTVTSQDGSTTRTEKKPMLLCAVEDIVDKGLQVGDYVDVQDNVYSESKRMKLTGIVDVLNFGIIADISLEVVDNARCS